MPQVLRLVRDRTVIDLVPCVYYSSLGGAIHLTVDTHGACYGLQSIKCNAYVCITLVPGDKIVKKTKEPQILKARQSREENRPTNRQIYK